MARGWMLENVEDAARASKTFFIPHQDERLSLEVGALARLHFVLTEPGANDPRAERMWVEIESVLGPGKYRGYLTNQPAAIEDLRPGDLIEFGAEHVARVLIERDDPRWSPNRERAALVSESVFEDCCRWLYREPPDRAEDSGWRLFSGRETQAQLDDAGRIRICNVGWLCAYDPTLEPILRTMEFVAFERGGASEPWERIEDWTPPQE